jgi:hypothetical protein
MRQTLTAGDDLPQAPDDQEPSVVIRASSPAALLTLVPHLLGFVPEASVVVIGVAPPRDRIRVTLRYDLPDPPETYLVADLSAHAVGVLSAQRLSAAVAVGYGPEDLVTPVARELREAAWQAGIDLREFLRVQDGRYWSYVCGNEACCPAAGVPFDASDPAAAAPAASADPAAAANTAADPAAADAADLAAGAAAAADPAAGAAAAVNPAAAAALARLGPPVLANRGAVAARVAPLGGIVAESMRQATRRAEQHIARLLAKVRKSARLGAARRMIAAEGLAAVGAMIARYRDGGRFTSDYEIARITVALRDLRVRDDAWARMDPAHADQHLRLWIDVVRRAQPGYVASPAALLAFVAWQSGDGALANVALDRALADDPWYSMALLLRQVITAGAPPSLARLPMTPEEVAASYDDADGDYKDPDHELDMDDHDPDMDDED